MHRLFFAIQIPVILSSFLPAQSVTFTRYTIPTASAYPYGITAGPDGALWFTEQLTSKVGRITTAGVITEFTTPTSGLPLGITAGPDGALWAADAVPKIRRITTSGVITEFPGPSGGSSAITTGPDGALWVTEYTKPAIARITTTGAVTEYSLPGNNQSYPLNGITVGPDGALWFTDGTHKAIGRITTSGVITEFSVPNSSGYMPGIVKGPDGALWFVDEVSFFVGRVTTAGVITEYSTMTAIPTAITVGPSGLLWFCDYVGQAIGSVTTSGNVTLYAATNAGQTTLFNGMAFGSDGALWLTSYYDDTIMRATTSTAPACSVNLSATSANFPATASNGSVNVTAASNCNWIASVDPAAPWIKIIAGASGTGSGTVSFSIDSNPAALSRTGAITIAGQTFTITQTGVTCFYSYGPTSQNFSSSGGAGSFSITAPPGCPWTVASNAPFISAPSPLSGSGNGLINYSVSQNTGSSQRTGIVTITGTGFSAAFTAPQAPAGPAYACSANTTPGVVRLEGVTELAADVLLQCAGTSTGAVTGDILVTLNTSVTSRTFDSTGTADPLLLINEPAAPVLNVDAFRGKITGANAVVFRNVPLRPASGSQTMRITNVRANASQLGGGANPGPVSISALIQMNAAVPIPITGQQQTVAIAQSSVTVQQGAATTGSDPTTQLVSLTFKEQFATAFKPAIAAGQDPSVLGQIYNSESGFVNSAQFGAATGRADSGTRLRAHILNIPGGTCAYAAVLSSTGSVAKLVSADLNGAGGTFVPGVSIFGGTYQQLACPSAGTTGSATATWELTAPDPLSIESSSVILLFQNAGSQISSIQIAASVGPVTQGKFAAGDSTVPIPRFKDSSVPIPVVNLRATSTVTTPSSHGSLLQEPAPHAISGGNVTFADQIVNDSSSTAPNVMTHTILPPSLTLASSTCASPPAGAMWFCDPDGHGLTIFHGSVAPHTPIAFAFTAKIDPAVLSGTLLQVTTDASSDLPLFDVNTATATVTLTVESSACSARITPSSSTNIPTSGGSLSFQVTSCPPWTAGVDQLWLSLTAGSYFNTASATVTVQAPANPGAARTANLRIVDQTVTITQAGSSHLFDFGGNGRSGALLYDPTVGQAYAAVSNGDGTYAYVPTLFSKGFDTLRTGDFNGDGKAELVLYNSHTALAYLGFGNGDGTFNFQSLFWSPNYDNVETRDINGDGKTDVALYYSTTGTLYTGISNGDGTFTYQYHLVSQGFTFVKLADFTGDGKADLFLYNATSGLAFLGIGDGTGNFSFQPLSISPGYNLADIGDLNGDGKADVILYNGTNGNAATGISNGSGGFTFTPLIFSPGFTSVKLADHTGDGKADVTVYDKNNAVAYFGTGNGDGTFKFQSLFWSPGYDYVVPEDVNGDGKTDIVLYDSLTGTEYTGISNVDGTFNYTYQYWGIGKVLAR